MYTIKGQAKGRGHVPVKLSRTYRPNLPRGPGWHRIGEPSHKPRIMQNVPSILVIFQDGHFSDFRKKSTSQAARENAAKRLTVRARFRRFRPICKFADAVPARPAK